MFNWPLNVVCSGAATTVDVAVVLVGVVMTDRLSVCALCGSEVEQGIGVIPVTHHHHYQHHNNANSSGSIRTNTNKTKNQHKTTTTTVVP